MNFQSFPKWTFASFSWLSPIPIWKLAPLSTCSIEPVSSLRQCMDSEYSRFFFFVKWHDAITSYEARNLAPRVIRTFFVLKLWKRMWKFYGPYYGKIACGNSYKYRFITALEEIGKNNSKKIYTFFYFFLYWGMLIFQLF